MNTRKWLCRAAAIASLAIAASASASAQGSPELTLTRFDCGKTQTVADVGHFSDVAAFKGLSVQLTFSCYLIKHGNDYLVWDTGNPAATGGHPAAVAPKSSLVEQLAQLHLKPEQISFVAISHYHGDHIGQVASFPQATLLIGKPDWDALNETKPNPGVNPANFAHWIGGGGKVEPVIGDKDVFGDGSVIMLNTPGHTPGHHSLLVKLKEKGNVLITGDLAHFRENYDSNGVPTFNTSRAETLASLDRFKQLAANLNATVIIQHDARDINKLPAFPASAK
ncbi:MAG TPA: N-acyl homoserine lactonase family protein [Steroidobacteraceae bacterium]|jgi:glyoxylase-like metal-dependent hydrolase (beta-lactamase superfamily II)|nr:N-acyl homoserine lactonase family protein [Steroidobacteraceae bacterium]